MMCDSQTFQDGRQGVGLYAKPRGQIGWRRMVSAECKLVQFRDAAFCDVETQACIPGADPAELTPDVRPGKRDATGGCRAVWSLLVQRM